MAAKLDLTDEEMEKRYNLPKGWVLGDVERKTLNRHPLAEVIVTGWDEDGNIVRDVEKMKHSQIVILDGSSIILEAHYEKDDEGDELPPAGSD